MVKRASSSEIKNVREFTNSRVAKAALRILKDPSNSKSAKVAAGIPLTQRSAKKKPTHTAA